MINNFLHTIRSFFKFRTLVQFVAMAVTLVTIQAVSGEEWFEIRREDRPITIQTSGFVVSDDVLQFSTPPTRSWRLSIAALATEGQRVQPGDLLVRFESSRAQRRLLEYKNELAAKRSELEALIEQQAEYIENENLLLAAAKSAAQKSVRKAAQPADLIPSVEYEKLVIQRHLDEKLLVQHQKRKPASERQRAAHRKAHEISIKRYEKRVQSEQEELTKFIVRAPRAGVVGIGVDELNEKFDVDSNPHPGMAIVFLMDDTKLSVRGEVPEHLAGKVAVGQKARVIFDSLGGLKLDGEIMTVGRTVRRKSMNSLAMIREFSIKLDNTLLPESIKMGVSAQITIDTEIQEAAIAVPLGALVYRNGSPGVVAPSGWQPVLLGPTSEGHRIVLEGLEEGDEVRL